MRMLKKSLAVLLAIVLVLSCVSMISAAEKNGAAATEAAKGAKGFKSTSFKQSNSYQYADDESVRAIIVMDGTPSADVAENGSTKAASNNVKLAKQHQELKGKMTSSKIDYTVNFEYTNLLNGMSVTVAYGDLEAISEMNGVKAVYIANQYAAPVYEPKMESSNEMTGLAVAHSLGVKGSGMVIAVLDTGMAAGHEAFAVYEGMLKEAALTKEAAETYIEKTGYGKYVSEKIPFSYDYADKDNNAEDSTNGHGVHVSGIAAGYAEAEDGAITFMGAAPDAQLLEMKIFNDVSAGTSSDIYFAALEDAYQLGADVINMSIGAPSGFTFDPELEGEVYGNIYAKLEKAGVVCCISAGNEGSMADNASNWAGDGYVTADYADYGIIGTPSTYDGNMSIASLENAAFPTTVLQVGELTIPYYDSDEEGQQFYTAMAGKKANFVDCGFGYPEDFTDADVTGKIALISRGDITFQEKVDNAAAAGAVAAIVYNNQPGIIYMSIDPYKVPAVTVSQADGQALLALLDGEEGGEETTAITPVIKGAKELPAAKRALPEAGSCVVLYNPAAGAILGYEEDTDYDDTTENYTYWNILASAATVNGTELRTAYMTAGTVYAVDNEDGTWSFIDQYDYDDSESIYLVASDMPDTFYSTAWDGTASYIITEVEGGYTLQSEGDGSYLCIHDGAVYSEALAEGDASFVWQFAAVETLEGTTAAEAVYVCTILDGTGEIGSEVEIILDENAPAMSFPEEMVVVENPDGWLMSDYSSWGCTPSLTLKPTITGVGGDVWSAAYNTEDGYVLYSGTSMAAPNVTGFMAVLLSELKDSMTSVTVPCATEEYDDVDQTKWYHDAVDYVVSEGYMGSTKTDALTFEPDTKVSRAMVASIMYRICGNPAVEYKGTFADVPEGTWYTLEVEFAGQNGLAAGKPGGIFDPNGAVTRQELATFMQNLAGFLGRDITGKADLSTFADAASVPGWSKEMLEWAVDAGIISGQAVGDKVYLNPTAGAMRSEFASIIMRFMGGSYVEGTIEVTKADRAATAEAIAESTAYVVSDADEYIYSPRKQGAGLIDAPAALKAIERDTYILDPIQNLFDNEKGEFEFTFTVTNGSDKAATFAVEPVAMYDYPMSNDFGEEGAPDVHNYNSLTSDYLTDEDCTITAPETVTVPAGGTADVTVKIELTAETKAAFDEIFPNGNFIEGYIFLDEVVEEGEDGLSLHATYMGFYGDWTKAPVMEQHDWREIVDAENYLSTTVADEDGNTYADYGYTWMDVVDFEVNSDINLAYVLNYAYLEQLGKLMGGYAGDNLFDYADYNEARIAISRGEDGICDTLYMMPMNPRNARHMIMVVSDATTGDVYYVDDTEYLPRSTFDSDNGYWANSGLFMWDGTDADGEVLPSDTVVDVNYYCNIAYGEDKLGAIDYADMKAQAKDYLEWNFQCTVDNDAPTFTYEYDEATKTLTVEATDNQYIASISLYAGDELVDSYGVIEEEPGKSVTATFTDVPADAVYELDVADYATNIAVKQIACGDVPTAKINFVIPEGTELSDFETENEFFVGTSIAMPEVFGEADGAYFVAWLPAEIEGTISDVDLDSEEYEWIWYDMLFDGDELTITEELDGTTYYAMFEKATGYYDPSEELSCCTADQEDWSGIWAIDGYDWDAEGEEDTYDYLLSADLSTFALAYDNEEEYVAYSFGYGSLIGAIDEHLFEIENTGLDEDGFGIYTIKTSAGKYLAIDEAGKLVLADNASDASATWDIWFDGDTACNILWNRSADYIIAFDQTTGTFSAIAAEDAVFDAPNNLYLYGLSAAGFEYFTATASVG